ncbi:MAG: alpha-IPM isomerase [Acidobacteria bacterium]|nr:alpha-IPM isomerase [Acidobacteriota bacterium]
MTIELDGRAVVLGDDVNTDYIISSSRKKDSLDPGVLRHFLFESVDPLLAASIRPGDLLVAGRNFGCGSAMEVAVTAVLAAGIRAVLARSFARTYYRNAINNGLIPIECDTTGIANGARLQVLIEERGARVVDRTDGRRIDGHPLPAIVLQILDEGGLVPYFRKRHDFTIP